MENFERLLSREYWVTQDGRKLFPHEFDDEHLSNTIAFLHRQARIQRLHEALVLCNMVHRFGYNGTDTEAYYLAYKNEVNKFLDANMTDEDWLKQNSKIYVLLLDEAKYRGVEINNRPQKNTYKAKIRTRYNYIPNYTGVLR
jgi:hypothetical protein